MNFRKKKSFTNSGVNRQNHSTEFSAFTACSIRSLRLRAAISQPRYGGSSQKSMVAKEPLTSLECLPRKAN